MVLVKSPLLYFDERCETRCVDLMTAWLEGASASMAL